MLALAVVIMSGMVAIAAGLFDAAPEEVAIVDIIEAISNESTAVTTSYFAGPEAVAEVVANAAERNLDPEDHVDLLRDLTVSQPNLDGTFIGYPDGGFIDMRRDVDDQLRIKTIDIADGERTVDLEIIDASGTSVESTLLLDDEYDPRTRPWYNGAIGAEHFWTDPYLFFSSGLPGITHSVPVGPSAAETAAVVGVDIRLADLDQFLEARRPSENGGAAVMSLSGEIVAGSTRLTESEPGQAAIDEWIDSSRLEPTTVRIEGDEPLVVSIAPVGIDSNQFLVIDAPESDFLGDVRTSREGLAVFSTLLGLGGLILLLLGALALRRYLLTLSTLASTDHLTGLLNRATFADRVDQAVAEGSNVTVISIDLDNFKMINDQFGHQSGDEALVELGKRLTAAAPRNALVARLGGDEFCIGLRDSQDYRGSAEHIATESSGTIEIDGYAIDLSLSAGFVTAEAAGDTSSQMLRRADVAMYGAKSRPGTSIIEFDDDMYVPWRVDSDRRELLVEAIQGGQMDVSFQPEFDLESGSLVGAEALLRWNQPTSGITHASEFVDDLERFDLLRELLPIVFARSEQLVDGFSEDDAFTVRVNISAKQLLSKELLDLLAHAIDATPVRWAIEITEQTLWDAPAHALSTLWELRDLGVEIVLDEFGAGATRLGKLESAPIDALKISSIFVRALDNSSLTAPLAAEAIIGLADALDIDVLASGIQTASQRDALIAAGYRRGQGNYLGEPKSIEDFRSHWLHGRKQAA